MVFDNQMGGTVHAEAPFTFAYSLHRSLIW